MKRQLIVGLSMAIALGALSPIYAYAQQNQAPTDAQSELNARLEERKVKSQTRLNNAEAVRLGDRCVAAQQKLAAVSKKFSENDTPLRAKYEAYILRLQKIAEKAESRGADTVELKKSTDDFGQKYQSLIASVNEFNLSLSDLKSVDCKANPTAFKATLDSARAEHKEVQAIRAELSSIAKGPIFESIKEIRALIEKGNN